MLYFTLSLLLNSESPALLSALLFAVHPVQAETVAWVSQRSNLISFFFFLLALYLWMKESRAPSVACYALALLGKEMAITLPLVLILYDVYRGKGTRKRIKYYMSFFITAVLYLILRTAVLGRISGQDAWAGGSIYTAMLTAFKAALFYARLLVLPAGLCVDPDFLPARSLFEPGVIASVLFVMAAILGGMALFRKGRRAEGFFIMWFFATLLPVSNIVPLKDVLVAERFLYFPAVGFCALASLLLLSVSKKGAIPAIAILLVFCGYRTINRNGDWKNSLTIWNATVKSNPHSSRARNNLGVAFGRNGNYGEAVESFRQAILLKPDYAEAYYNLGLCYGKSGRYEEEIAAYEKAILFKPDYHEAYNNTAMAQVGLGLYEEALSSFERAVAINPEDAAVRYNMGMLYVRLGNEKAASEQYGILKNLDKDMASSLLKSLGR